MKKLFGTDGVRGMANRHPMIPEMALAMGQAIAFYFSRQKKGKGRIVIGKDTRRSGYMFEYALSAGVSSMGCQTILTGPLPTPAIAFITTAMRADAGIVISASHNPYHDNGIKFFDHQGFKLPDKIEMQMEEFIFSSHDDSLRPTGLEIGRAIRIKDAVGRYAEFLKSTFPKDLTLEGLKVVIDCAHGAAYKIGPLLLTEMGADVVGMGVEPNGGNINADCGALHPESLAARVRQEKAHVGIALDGDADRVVMCDEKGNLIDGDCLLALCATELKKAGRLSHDTIVGTVLSNMGLEHYLKQHRMKLVRTAVGDRPIVEEMRKKGYTFGGEPSGHIIFLDLSTTGDGLLAALQVLAIMIKEGKPLSELAHRMPIFPQKSKNIPVKLRKDLKTIKPLQKEIQLVEKELGEKGRVILRYSGTEPLLRLTIEGESEKSVDKYLHRLNDCLVTHL